VSVDDLNILKSKGVGGGQLSILKSERGQGVKNSWDEQAYAVETT
jgi:hypothetical protein